MNSGGASRDMFWTCEVCKDREVVFVGDGAVPRGAISAEEASLRGWGQSVSGERHCPLHGERIATAPAHDPVNHPAHYTSHPSGVECIDVCESMSFNPGNAVKYLFRRDHKGGRLEDTRKAAWYLRREEARLLAAEQWLPVEGDARYDVSNLGRIRRGPRERALVQTKGGYMTFLVTRPGAKPKLHYVHQDVLRAFVGPRPSGHQAAHWDGNKRNNALSNLRWATVSENLADRVRHGTANDGERGGRSKLTRARAMELRELRGQISATEASGRFGITRSTVSRLWNGVAWRDRPEPSAAGRVLSVEPESAVLAVVLRALLREGGTLPASVAEAAAAVETEIQRLEKK